MISRPAKISNRWSRGGFTLIELLVVISISVLLLGLVLAPVIQTFNMTSRTNAMVQAQDTARLTLEQVSREVGQAMFVYDNSNSLMNFPVENPDGTTQVLTALYGKIDLMLPKLAMHCKNPNHPNIPPGQPRDYERGDEAWPPCPVCRAANVQATDDDVETRPKQPLSGDPKIVRYFVGLKNPDPAAIVSDIPVPGYHDWGEGASPINGFILYRAEFSPTDPNLFPVGSDGNLDSNDPNFFYNNTDAPNGERFWKNWKRISVPVVPKGETDLVTFKLNSAGTLYTAVMPTVRFQLTRMTADAFAPTYITDEAAESPAAVPTLYRASYGAWASSRGASEPNPYYVTLFRPGSPDAWYRAETGSSGHVVINKYLAGASTGTPIADVSNYVLSVQLDTTDRIGTFPSPDPDVLFMIDSVRGEARFDLPGRHEIPKADIVTMNANVAANWGPGDVGPRREYQITRFLPANNAKFYRIVPGTEVVMGPNMTPGIAAGEAELVRYERVPFNLGDPGRNQYRIDYGMRNVADCGRMFFSPEVDEIIPPTMVGGNSTITITYRFQCNQDGDIVTGNYSTKSLLTITMGIRYYDRGTGKVQPVELTNKVRVRNLMR